MNEPDKEAVRTRVHKGKGGEEGKGMERREKGAEKEEKRRKRGEGEKRRE